MKVIFILLDKIRAHVHRKARGGGGGGCNQRKVSTILTAMTASMFQLRQSSLVKIFECKIFVFFSVLLILLLNVKMPTTVGILAFMSSCWHFNIISRINLMLS